MFGKEEINSVFFDLDGTLLPIDLDDFLEKYFGALTGEFSDLAESDKLVKILMKSTEAMIENDGSKTNKEVFMDSFFSLLNAKNRSRTMKRFEEFYRTTYPRLRHKLDIHKRGSKLVEMLREAGYKLVLATNPLFPHIAVVERMKWAGINPGDFDFISSYEKLHFSKPNPDFFIELTNRTGVEPKNCVMIGNDVQEDLVASELGMKTFLIEDYIIDRSEGPHYTPDWRGSLEELISLVEEKVAV